MWLLFSWRTEIPMQDVMWHLNFSNHKVIDKDDFVLDVRNHPQPLGGFDNNGSPIVLCCILAVNFAQLSPEHSKRLFKELTTLSQKSCYIGCERCLGLNNYCRSQFNENISKNLFIKIHHGAVSKTPTSFVRCYLVIQVC